MPPTSRKHICLYTKDNLNSAIEAINAGSIFTATAEKYRIPRSTLRAKILKKYADKNPSPNTILTVDEEDLLVDWIFYMSRNDFPVTKLQVINSVQVLVRNLNRNNPFKDDKPDR
ncbi:hypothetical protein ALC62_15365 [Cyphomyrmex costatus]|uniref:HTH psq-type domain-containing protein n=1 Tax=Cyphomyrmex costatus TaxID=456900 RepID=A0A151I7D7_9HYME|nr:hypothetical protein ALC62_15365 [Cyphomyrmex costatus]